MGTTIRSSTDKISSSVCFPTSDPQPSIRHSKRRCGCASAVTRSAIRSVRRLWQEVFEVVEGQSGERNPRRRHWRRHGWRPFLGLSGSGRSRRRSPSRTRAKVGAIGVKGSERLKPESADDDTIRIGHQVIDGWKVSVALGPPVQASNSIGVSTASESMPSACG